jgi:hypothetical protein
MAECPAYATVVVTNQIVDVKIFLLGSNYALRAFTTF